jgi:hypothetical protein
MHQFSASELEFWLGLTTWTFIPSFKLSPLSWKKANIGGEGKRILGACQPRKTPLCQDGEVNRKRES